MLQPLVQPLVSADFGGVIYTESDHKVGSPCQAKLESHFGSRTVAADRFLLGRCRSLVEGARDVTEIFRREALGEISPSVWLGLPQDGASPAPGLPVGAVLCVFFQPATATLTTAGGMITALKLGAH